VRHFSAAHALSAAAAPVARSAQAERPAQARGAAPTSRRTSCLRPSVLSRPRLSRGAEPVCEELVRVDVDGEDASTLESL